jgi:hypothetical protein
MNGISKFKASMRWASMSLSVLLALAYLGCNRSGSPVRFVLPEGFHGVFQICEDKKRAVDLIKTNEMLLIIVPTNGLVVVKDSSFLEEWHGYSAEFPDGKLISEVDFDTNAVVLHDLFSKGDISSGSTNYFLVGTDREARIAGIADAFGEMPLARPLSENDIPR